MVICFERGGVSILEDELHPTSKAQLRPKISGPFCLEKGPSGKTRVDETGEKNLNCSADEINKNLLQERGES